MRRGGSKTGLRPTPFVTYLVSNTLLVAYKDEQNWPELFVKVTRVLSDVSTDFFRLYLPLRMFFLNLFRFLCCITYTVHA